MKTDAGPGRPPGQRNYATLYREALIKLAQKNGKEPNDLESEILQNALASARKGDYRFYKDMLDRLYGTATNRTDLTTNGDKLVFLPAELMQKNGIDTSSRTSEDSPGHA